MVFQEPRLMPWLTVRENVRLALLDLPKAEQDARIGQAIEEVDLTKFIDAFPRQLSGGMAQRTAIARALVRSEEHTSELQSLMRISYAVFCLKKKTIANIYSCQYQLTHVRINY